MSSQTQKEDESVALEDQRLPADPVADDNTKHEDTPDLVNESEAIINEGKNQVDPDVATDIHEGVKSLNGTPNAVINEPGSSRTTDVVDFLTIAINSGSSAKPIAEVDSRRNASFPGSSKQASSESKGSRSKTRKSLSEERPKADKRRSSRLRNASANRAEAINVEQVDSGRRNPKKKRMIALFLAKK